MAQSDDTSVVEARASGRAGGYALAMDPRIAPGELHWFSRGFETWVLVTYPRRYQAWLAYACFAGLHALIWVNVALVVLVLRGWTSRPAINIVLPLFLVVLG